MTRWWLPALLTVALFSTACGDPPNKEMDQAQGAIDAAKAAGADRYAPSEFAAAREALEGARRAVAVRDYRLALNDALESREHAQNAARDAADSKARLRSEVERSMADIATSLAEANSRMQIARRARGRAKVVRDQEQSLAAVNAAVQKTGAAVKAGDYLGATEALEGVKLRIETIIAALETRTPAQSPRRRR